jgi:hypothetical protein
LEEAILQDPTLRKEVHKLVEEEILTALRDVDRGEAQGACSFNGGRTRFEMTSLSCWKRQ